MRFNLYAFKFFLIGVLSACRPEAPEDTTPGAQLPLRFGSVTGLNPEKAAYYRKLHTETWPGVLKMIHECNIRNYSIYQHEIDGKLYLFSYYEYIGNDYEADMKKMAADTVTQRWWRETDPCQIPLPEAAADNKIWTDMEEVFHAE